MTELFIDTETTGFFHGRLPLDHDDQPHIVEIAMLMIHDGQRVAQASLVVECPIEVPEQAFAIHGISQDITKAAGVRPIEAISLVEGLCRSADRIIAHNADFDRKMLEIALTRHGHPIPWIDDQDRWFCTMKAAAPLCKMPLKSNQIRAEFRKTGLFKMPRLGEALEILCGIKESNLHSALADVEACAKIYAAIMARKEPPTGTLQTESRLDI